MVKTRKRDSEKAAIVKKAARIHGVSNSTVYKVWNGTRGSEAIMETIMKLLEDQDYTENKLIEAVKLAVPF